ncbi:MAG TPA: hypothetical protein VLA23_04100 [Candidatus Limnocylindrales bacterium]|nr:hypothetical protein [Candidatus Limnocylindrales bacterium]
MSDSAVSGMAGETHHLRRLTGLIAGALLTMASAACGGAAPATMTGGPTPSAVSTQQPGRTTAPTPVPTASSPEGRTPGPITWDVLQAPAEVRDVVSTGALLVAVGLATTTPEGDTAGAWTSSDGRVWRPSTVAQPAGAMTAVAGGPGRLVAVGTVFDGTNRPAAWTSVDGREWQALPASAFAGSSGYEPGALADVAAGPGGGFVAVGSEVGAGGHRAAAWYSPDGLSWVPARSGPGGGSAGAVVAFGAGYVAAGWTPGEDRDDRALFWTSADGRTWTAAPDAEDLHDVGGTPILAALGPHLVAVGYRSHQFVPTEPIVWTSQDGVTWMRQPAGGVAAPLPSASPLASEPPLATGLAVGGLIGADGVFIAAGETITFWPSSGTGPGPRAVRRMVWTSSTGASWSVVAELPGEPADPGVDFALVGPLVAHQGRLLVFGRPTGDGSAVLWETDLQGILDLAD